MIEVRDCVCLVTNEVVETICAVGVYEAVSDPFSCPYAADCQSRLNIKSRDYSPFVDIRNNLKSSLNAIILYLSSLDSGNVVVPRKSKNVESVFTGN